MYDRNVNGRELNFEASGALLQASLVMRDRETDSWWSIMTSTAIGGALQGAERDELPIGEKTTWADWRRRHPNTLVLSVDGEEHHSNNPYDNYFASDRTFHDLEISDDRLEPKTPVFSFWLNGQTYAAAHSTFEGGRLLTFRETLRARCFSIATLAPRFSPLPAPGPSRPTRPPLLTSSNS